jgi:hypothetical protein
MSKYLRSFSMPMNLLPRFTQAKPTVPLPINGSQTIFPGTRQTDSIPHLTGFGHGCPSTSRSGSIGAVKTSTLPLTPLPHSNIGSQLQNPRGDLPIAAGLSHAICHLNGLRLAHIATFTAPGDKRIVAAMLWHKSNHSTHQSSYPSGLSSWLSYANPTP